MLGVLFRIGGVAAVNSAVGLLLDGPSGAAVGFILGFALGMYLEHQRNEDWLHRQDVMREQRARERDERKFADSL
jgi:hypothetical protein